MTDNTKVCSKCNIEKPLEEFTKLKLGSFGKGYWCKSCRSEYRKEHLIEINERRKKWRYKNGVKPMYENKDCAAYLGVVVGERLCRHLFKDVEVMPYGHSGYDIICNKGKKIDVKTSTLNLHRGKRDRWSFKIRENKIADYFICVAFDNVEYLNPLHIWMIPGYEVNKHKVNLSIGKSTIHKWDKWRRSIEEVQLCCTEIKNNG